MSMNYDQQRDETAQVDDMAQVDADLLVLERLQRFRVDFAEQICAASKSRSLDVLSVLQLEAMHPFAEFYFLLRARGIESDADRNGAQARGGMLGGRLPRPRAHAVRHRGGAFDRHHGKGLWNLPARAP